MHAAKEELRRRAQEACAEVAPVRSLALETLWSLLSLLERSALSPCQFDWRKIICEIVVLSCQCWGMNRMPT